MLTLLKWLAGILGVMVLAVVLFFLGMRFHDGPIEVISGGPFKSGEPAETPDDWRAIADYPTIEFQTMDPVTSRTVWLAVHDGDLYLVSGYMTTDLGKLWKQWPHYVERDDRIVLRVDGKLYEQKLERIQEGDVIDPVMAEFGRKYGVEGGAASVRAGRTWLYKVVPR